MVSRFTIFYNFLEPFPYYKSCLLSKYWRAPVEVVYLQYLRDGSKILQKFEPTIPCFQVVCQGKAKYYVQLTFHAIRTPTNAAVLFLTAKVKISLRTCGIKAIIILRKIVVTIYFNVFNIRRCC